jgi:mRNA interferase MazF
LIPFPFSDLSQAKLRPALVLADAGRNDWNLCQITSNPYSDARAVILKGDDFEQGSLDLTSFARPGKLFTGSSRLIVAEVGVLRAAVTRRVIQAVIDLLSAKRKP